MQVKRGEAAAPAASPKPAKSFGQVLAAAPPARKPAAKAQKPSAAATSDAKAEAGPRAPAKAPAAARPEKPRKPPEELAEGLARRWDAPEVLAPQPHAASEVQRVEGARGAEIAAQIEKVIASVEQVARAEGPALQIALHDGELARIEVTRVAKGEVALTVQARTPEDRRGLQAQLGRIRQALVGRGLKVRELRVG
jgi:hypothetical protein